MNAMLWWRRVVCRKIAPFGPQVNQSVSLKPSALTKKLAASHELGTT